jgi:hypothetical protein
MKNFLLTIAMLLCSFTCFAQIVINEFDADTQGTDLKEFIELKTDTPFFTMDGYVLVCYNGAADSAFDVYYTLDLDGLTSDANGLATIGNDLVSPVPNRYLPNSTFQNGADGVAIHLGNPSNFPYGSVATSNNLIAALVYDTNDADATVLMELLNVSTQYNENENAASTSQSIQRKADGTYETKPPTPGANNDGSGVVFNGLSIVVNPSNNIFEGNTISISFNTQTAVETEFSFNYTLQNGLFTSADFSGSLSVTMPSGANSVSKIIQLVDDTLNEGDEVMKIAIGELPANYIKLSDNVEVRINDNDFIVHPWGTPINPTYGLVSSTAPNNYYASLEGKSGAVLKQAIQDIIANPNVVREHNYGDAYDILKEADQNPENSSQVWLMYVETPRSKIDLQTGTSGAAGYWNREHIYSQSRGGFIDATSSNADGINSWDPTDANDIFAGHSDAHHIRAEDSPENSLRSERNYGIDYNGPAGSQGSWRGDVARAIFYMAVRYNGLSVVNGNPNSEPDGSIGDLSTLLSWNGLDTADDFEMNRNNIIYTWQKNRNPFIDFPTLANYIWGPNAGQNWFAALSTTENEALSVSLFPNPAKNQITISGTTSDSTIAIYNLSGMQLYQTHFIGTTTIPVTLASGMYLAKITSDNKTAVKKLIIR